jgi:peptidoglycan/LPS O-acetylase OafA/YrhL
LNRAVAALLATIAIAALSYRYFEAPFLRLKQKLARIQSRPI